MAAKTPDRRQPAAARGGVLEAKLRLQQAQEQFEAWVSDPAADEDSDPALTIDVRRIELAELQARVPIIERAAREAYERARVRYVDVCQAVQGAVFTTATADVRAVFAEIEATVSPLLDKLDLARARQRTGNTPTSLPRHEQVLGEFPQAAPERADSKVLEVLNASLDCSRPAVEFDMQQFDGEVYPDC